MLNNLTLAIINTILSSIIQSSILVNFIINPFLNSGLSNIQLSVISLSIGLAWGGVQTYFTVMRHYAMKSLEEQAEKGYFDQQIDLFFSRDLSTIQNTLDKLFEERFEIELSFTEDKIPEKLILLDKSENKKYEILTFDLERIAKETKKYLIELEKKIKETVDKTGAQPKKYEVEKEKMDD